MIRLRDFTNKDGIFEGDHFKVLQLVKESMCTPQDKQIVNNMFSLEEALNDSNLANSTFSYLNKLSRPRNSKESHTNLTDIFHKIRIFINFRLLDRIRRLTIDTLIMKGFTNGGKFKYR